MKKPTTDEFYSALEMLVEGFIRMGGSLSVAAMLLRSEANELEQRAKER